LAESDAPALFPELVSQPVASYTTGLLPSQRLEELIQSGRIHANTPISPDQVQPASIELRFEFDRISRPRELLAEPQYHRSEEASRTQD